MSATVATCRSATVQTVNWPLVAAIFLGATLRLADLGAAPLWSDEVATRAFASLSWAELFGGLGRLEPNPPAFYALEKLWTSVAGSSDLAFRLPAALCGIAAIPALYSLTRASFGPTAALCAALLLALNPQHLEHARDARAYAPLFLVVAVSLLMALRIARSSTPSTAWPQALALAALSALAISLHYTAVVAAAAVFICATVAAIQTPGPARQRILLLATSGSAAVLLALPAMLAMLDISADPANNASWIPEPNAFMVGVFALSTWTIPYTPLRSIPVDTALMLLGCGLVVTLLVVAAAIRRTRRGPATSGLLSGLVAALVLMTGISLLKPIMVEKTFMFSLVFFLPLLAALLAELSWIPRIALLTLLLGPQTVAIPRIYADTRNREDWTGVAETLQAQVRRTGWPVIVRNGFDAMALDHVLPHDAPARAAVSLTPEIGARLSRAIAEAFTRAIPLPETVPVDTLCATLHHPGGAYLVVWNTAFPKWHQHAATDLLASAGGNLAQTSDHGIFTVQAWPGVCATPPPAPAP